MKGIILAGGSGTRLYPMTLGMSKQLLPVYDKPMIYYPLSVLMNLRIRDILIISTEEDMPRFRKLLTDGSRFGVNLEYATQPSPSGLAQAFLIGENFIGNDAVTLILGDNVFVGFQPNEDVYVAIEAAEKYGKSTIFGYKVKDPKCFGVVEFDQTLKILSLEEKPQYPKSNYGVVGMYFYDNKVVEYTKRLKPSMRGELEITDLNNLYLENESLSLKLLNEDVVWMDAGTPDSLLEVSNLVKSEEAKQGKKVACLEEIAYREGWITEKHMLDSCNLFQGNQYGEYLRDIFQKST